MSDDIDRSNWSQADHDAESFGQDLVEPTTGESVPRTPDATTPLPEEGPFGVAQIDFVFDSWDEAFSDYSATSFLRMDITPEEEGELGPLASPDLVGGEVHVTLDFDALTVSGSFDLLYECDGRQMGSPTCDLAEEGFAGTVSGRFDQLPVRVAPQGVTPRDYWMPLRMTGIRPSPDPGSCTVLCR